MIELKNIDLSKVSLKAQYKKVFEEQHELERELFKLENENFMQSLTSVPRISGSYKQKAIAEFWDVVQAWLGVLAKDNITAYDVMKSYPKHLEKLKHRPRD